MGHPRAAGSPPGARLTFARCSARSSSHPVPLLSPPGRGWRAVCGALCSEGSSRRGQGDGGQRGRRWQSGHPGLLDCSSAFRIPTRKPAFGSQTSPLTISLLFCLFQSFALHTPSPPHCPMTLLFVALCPHLGSWAPRGKVRLEGTRMVVEMMCVFVHRSLQCCDTLQ